MLGARQENDSLPGVGEANTATTDARLFRALIEDLRLPLLQIARQSELIGLETNRPNPADIRNIEATADAALKLIDSYIFSTKVLLGQQQLPLEPVSVTAMLHDTAQYMRDIARLYNYDIEVSATVRTGLVMANPKGLQAAFISLAYACIGGIMSNESSKLVLTTQKSQQGITAGVMVHGKKISRRALAAARQTYGYVRQPLLEDSHTSSAGIYVADSLLLAMNSQLTTKSARGKSGFVATLLPSHQLALL